MVGFAGIGSSTASTVFVVGSVKTSARSRASVDLPDEEQPEMATVKAGGDAGGDAGGAAGWEVIGKDGERVDKFEVWSIEQCGEKEGLSACEEENIVSDLEET